MEADHHEGPSLDLLTLALSTFEAKSLQPVRDKNLFKTSQKNFFTSLLNEDDKFLQGRLEVSSNIFFKTPRFEFKANTKDESGHEPAKARPSKRNFLLKKSAKDPKCDQEKEIEDSEEDNWISLAMANRFLDIRVAETWETMPPRKPISTQTSKRVITDIQDVESIHVLWSIAVDKLLLVSTSSSLQIGSVVLLQDNVLQSDICHLLIGMASSTFSYDTLKQTFRWRNPQSSVASISLETLHSSVDLLIEMGNMCYRLESIANDKSNVDRGRMYRGLISGLQAFLRLYRTSMIQVSKNRKLLQLHHVVRPLRRQLAFVHRLFAESPPPDGLELLLFLCQQSLPINDFDLQHLAISFFRSAAQPFFAFLHDWAFHGKLDRAYSEFGINISPIDLSERNRRFWTHGCTLTALTTSTAQASDSFGFIQQLLPMILSCGKTIHLLQLCQARSPVATFTHHVCYEPIEVILNADQEEKVKKKYLKYYHEFKLVLSTGDLNSKQQEQQQQKEELQHLVRLSAPARVSRQSSNHYWRKFDIFDAEPTDILEKVRDSSKSTPATKPCFTPLASLLEKSILLPLRAQYRVVCDKGSHFLLHDVNLIGHLTALRRYLFFGDPEFSRSFCDALFGEMDKNPDGNWGPGQLSSIVEQAIASSPFAFKDPFAENVSFYVEGSIGHKITKSNLKLSYKTSWPVNLILTEEVLTSYADIFSFLLQICRCTHGLQRTFMLLKNNRDAATFRFHLIRHEMSHFILLLDSYFKSIVIEQSWKILQEEFFDGAASKSIDHVYNAHTNYVKRILFRCFLNKKAESIKNLIFEIIWIVQTFCDVIATRQDRAFSQVEGLFKRFKERESFLTGVLWKLTNRGYQQHLQEFLLQLSAGDATNAKS